MAPKNIFVTGIDTDSGKTLVSAILCEALGYDYWKPVQAGLPRDADLVSTLITNRQLVVHPETHLLREPMSPHAAAKRDGIEIQPNDFIPPATSRGLIIEGAGGILVPLNDHDLMIDLMSQFRAPVVLVSDLYLGSINHTLLSVEALRRRTLTILGIVFNGPENPDSESLILSHTGLPCILRLGRADRVDADWVRAQASKLNIPTT
jgi:dethiobiotin synthetase